MKTQHLMIAATSALLLAAATVVAQDVNTPTVDPEPPVIGPPDRDRPELPDETKQLIVDYRETQEEIREARRADVEAYRAENPDATMEDIRLFVQEWNEANSELLDAQEEVREQIREDLAELAPDLPDELREDIDQVRGDSQTLREGRRTAVADFLAENPDATPEEVRAVVEAYNQDNLEEIERLARERQGIRQEIRDLRPGNGGAGNPERREAIRDAADQLRDLRQQFLADLASAVDEAARQEIRDQFREDRRAILDELKAEARAAAEASREGDR